MSFFKQLMANSKIRSSGGCWTCRVRRKKCTENRPECDTCKALEITCYFDDDKPAWMDGGPRQRQMTEDIKAEVKKKASQRRDRKYVEILENETRIVTISDDGDALMSSSSKPGASDTDPSPRSHDSASTPPDSHSTSASPPDVAWHTQQPLAWHTQQPPVRPQEDAAEGDLHFLMIYLDYVFPYLFPHYRPPVLAGGRGWILDVLHSNKSVHHTSISLASSFFAIVLANGDREHQECIARMIHKLETQLELGLKELQREMCALNASSSGFDVQRGLVVMQSIVQMLFFEVTTSSNGNWRMHLDAAVALFLQILPDPDLWTQTLNNLYSPAWPPPDIGLRRPWSTNQAALRFFTATLLYLDVLSSVTLGTSPRLCHYQAAVIPGCSTVPRGMEPVPAGPLFLDDFFGLPNWIVQALGDVAGLEAWKRLQMQAGSLSVDELASRGQLLGDAITGGLEALEHQAGDDDSSRPTWFPALVADPITGPNTRQQPDFQMIWLLATLSYLKVVILGWQPSNPQIRCPVSRATERLSRIPKGSCLRALAWPFCISGCLSPAEDEHAYRAMAQTQGPLQIFGTVKEAMQIMEKVWSRRGRTDETWTVSRCLNVLGHGVLLI
ncbi:hypothetical protein G6O67_007439 [Ophiocordyceps sinensis]|uniref:Zn(2)-C6 fungal-type domain-containing protein n=1 Tax=Ophiocordyceps sinensis TaxID=72228 RepID=A0A8H4PNV1_9HYPO|nr:hypothetical protein G6O67_007439 [Ophiocordyceps sinensis]